MNNDPTQLSSIYQEHLFSAIRDLQPISLFEGIAGVRPMESHQISSDITVTFTYNFNDTEEEDKKMTETEKYLDRMGANDE